MLPVRRSGRTKHSQPTRTAVAGSTASTSPRPATPTTECLGHNYTDHWGNADVRSSPTPLPAIPNGKPTTPAPTATVAVATPTMPSVRAPAPRWQQTVHPRVGRTPGSYRLAPGAVAP